MTLCLFDKLRADPLLDDARGVPTVKIRSEERRVGKECQ